jgi:hypothetical protein
LIAFHVIFTSSLLFGQIVVSFTSGALSPEWVKPTAEGGGFFLLVFVFICSCFQDVELVVDFANMYFAHIAFTADGS